jgi:dihydrofolate synthase/folylpolyglutamate synthase
MTSPATATAELLLKFQHMHPRSIDLSLDRVLRLLAALGDPHKTMAPVIHVAGTNGKGSVVAFLRAMLESAGLAVHVFTSPHLRAFNERIVLGGAGGGKPIAERALLEVLTRAEAANDGQPITFFEITSAAAFLAYAENPADVVLLETGLGGRLDATNVVEKPLLTVITPISIDHSSFLGDTFE